VEATQLGGLHVLFRAIERNSIQPKE